MEMELYHTLKHITLKNYWKMEKNTRRDAEICQLEKVETMDDGHFRGNFSDFSSFFLFKISDFSSILCKIP